jgi:hypothetical protein
MQERWVSMVAAWAASMALGLAACGGGEPPPGTLFSADCPLGFCPESDTLGVGETAPAYAVTWAGNALQIEARFGKSANLFAEVHLSGGDSVSATVDNVVVPLVDAQGYRAQWVAQWATVSATPVVSMLFHRGTSSWPSTVTVPARFAPGRAGTVSAQRTQASLSVAVAPAVPEPLRLSISSGQCKRIDATVQEVKDRDVGYSTPGSGGGAEPQRGHALIADRTRCPGQGR